MSVTASKGSGAMARPKKTGLDYFPFDVDFFRGVKIRITLARYGASGVLLFIYLLSLIYSGNGYYLEYDDDLKYIAAADLRMKPDNIGQIINFFCKRSLFDNKLFTTDKVLTSTGIQKRYQEAIKGRVMKRPKEERTETVNAKLWLLKSEETQSFIKVHPNSDNSKKNSSYSENNSINSKNNTTKESKVNKSKVNERRVVLQLPCTNGIYDVTSEQVELLEQVYTNIDVMASLLNLVDFAHTNPDKQRPLAGAEIWIRKWLTGDSNGTYKPKSVPTEKSTQINKPDNKNNKSDNTSYDINVFYEHDIFE